MLGRVESVMMSCGGLERGSVRRALGFQSSRRWSDLGHRVKEP